MDDRTFWQIIEETHDKSIEKQEQKLYTRLDATEQEQLMKDPDYVMETFGVTLGEEKVFTVDSQEVEIDEWKATIWPRNESAR